MGHVKEEEDCIMKASPFFPVFGIVLLSWNVVGITAFVLSYWNDLTAASTLLPIPGWTAAGYGVAVIAAMVGAALLLMRKSAATTMFLVSLIAVIVQLGYTLLGTDLVATKGVGVVIFTDFIITAAILQLLYARPLVAKGILH